MHFGPLFLVVCLYIINEVRAFTYIIMDLQKLTLGESLCVHVHIVCPTIGLMLLFLAAP